MKLAVVCWRPVLLDGKPQYDAAFAGHGAHVPVTTPLVYRAGQGVVDLGVHIGNDWVVAFMPLAVTGALDRDFTAAAPNQYRQTGEVIRASLNAFAQGQNVNLGGMLECLLVGMHTNHDYESESSQLALGLQSPQRHFTFVDARYSNDEPPADHLDDDLGVSSNEVYDRFVNVANGVGIDANLKAVYDFGAEDHMRSCHIREV